MPSSFQSDSRSSSSYLQSDTSYSSESMFGTPKKTATASTSQHTTSEEMKNALKKDFDGHVCDHVSIAEFVEHVWKLDQATSKKISDANLLLRPEPLEKYRQILTPGGKLSEPELHQPFREMARGLLKDVCDVLSIDHGMLTTYLWDGSGKATFRSESANAVRERIRKPDLLEVFIPMTKDGQLALNPDESPMPKAAPMPMWYEVRASVEFKKKKLQEVDTPGSDLQSIAEDQPASATGTGTGPRACAASRYVRTTPSSDSNAISQDSAQTGSKRSASSLSNDNRPTKKTRVNVTRDELQLATYALECLYVGNRHYVTGIFIDGFSIKLWYYDRTAVMCTDFLDFGTTSGTTDLALALFALSQCNMQQAGFDPYLHQIILPEASQFIQPSFIVPLVRPEKDVTQLCYRFPSLSPQNDCIFMVQEFISQYKGINGRGTTAISGRLGFVGETLSKRLYVLKVSWQYTTRKHEGNIVRQLRDALPGWTNHLPDPVFHAKFTGATLGLPSHLIREILAAAGRTSLSEKKNRDLHIIITNRYKNIWKARDVDEFKRIFLECLECHYHAYNTGRVLHRDVSENNLMIYQPGVTDQDPAQPTTEATKSTDASKEPPLARGILNDFDMAAILNSDGKADQSGPSPHHHITGTRPFMARDLLDPGFPKGPHFYRYELESFFYVLLWATGHYDLLGGRNVIPKSGKKSEFEAWGADDKASSDSKHRLFSGRMLERFERDLRKEWQTLWDDWIVPLAKMFRNAFIGHDCARTDKLATYDYATCDGAVTFATFMRTIGATPRGLKPEASIA
ncbi:hypothetical protein CVT25_014304 [Psilocybe cyanescens]|uniref:Fungal-type protein kinase domain-containing protein n=1 Tax=Psilocybe cyanescens TaxID=93625 RepID=A0A409XL36_PSICY|nr:hypothetical protein CVT25_014304 [Psilocybe cyanescens]